MQIHCIFQYALQQHVSVPHQLQSQTSEDAFDFHVQERLQQQQQKQQQVSATQQQQLVSSDIYREPNSQGPGMAPASRLAGPTAEQTEVPQEQLIEFSSGETDDQTDTAVNNNKTFQGTESKSSTALPPSKPKQKVKANVSITVMILNFRTDRSEQSVRTQVRLLEEQSDQGLHYLPFHPHLLDILLYDNATVFKF